ncbi:MAG TPA: indole-3-glycerol phosphate synthase TrpC [Armatimonadota bacterium]|nr:indole-3-glycerol phosphate synthase TrpC [Armatimonadota bacterium]
MILDDIVAHKRDDLARRKLEAPLGALNAPTSLAPPSLAAALAGPGVSLIAELKKASPSKGLLRPDYDPQALARAYQRGGAAALSCLTDERFFQGHADHLEAARAASGLPVLRKDFTLDAYHVHEARAMGASAVLLIAAILTDAELAQLLGVARGLGLDALVEAHDVSEARRALDCGAQMLGINNRDLRDFSVDLHTTERILDALPSRPPIVVAESGIHTAADMAYLRQLGVQAALVGEALVTAADPAAKARELVEGGRPL